MIMFTLETKNILYEEAKSWYPKECCGILLGKRNGDVRMVTKIYRTQNALATKQQEKHFLIPTTEIVYAEYLAAKEGEEIVGFYHSHTDSWAIASKEDESYAIPGISYPIISVLDGEIDAMSSWEKCYQEDMESFIEETIEIK